ncbi:Release factor glutamine methyltransferase [Elsinoe australis]|uniref:Release factor glutamine methyltransferase n=1 Tax=Elsinoe australis TaxID=40998 RepID=A0A2P7YPZ4_9PEZI|nr:Release factor glutamine methyltransferase [Elsinoe australis]
MAPIVRLGDPSTTTHLATLLNSPQAPRPSRLKILDLCTGTGCITLLISHLLSRHCPVHVLGLDISPTAISLAKENLALYPAGPGSKVDFRVADVLASPASPSAAAVSDSARNSADSDAVSNRDDAPPGWRAVLRDFEAESEEDIEAVGWTAADRDRSRTGKDSWHVLVSNPPYVSPRQYRLTTTKSVRGFEPRLALVPPEHDFHSQGITTDCANTEMGKAEIGMAANQSAGDPESVDEKEQDEKAEDERAADGFYPALLNVAIEKGVKVLLFEVGDAAQALRVVRMVKEALGEKWDGLGVEVWRDEPGADPEDVDGEAVSGGGELPGVFVRGRGNVRAVFAWNATGDLIQ